MSETLDLPLILLMAVAFLLLVLMVVMIRSKSSKKSKALKVAPNLVFQNIQISPLGKDALVQIKNIGETATVQSILIKNRPDITIQNPPINYNLDNQKLLRIFCETRQKIGKETISFDVFFNDVLGNAYQQSFDINNGKNNTEDARLVKYA